MAGPNTNNKIPIYRFFKIIKNHKIFRKSIFYFLIFLLKIDGVSPGDIRGGSHWEAPRMSPQKGIICQLIFIPPGAPGANLLTPGAPGNPFTPFLGRHSRRLPMGSASNLPIKSGSLGPRGPPGVGPLGGAPGDGAPGVGPLGPWGALGPQGGSLGRAPGGGPRGNF